MQHFWSLKDVYLKDTWLTIGSFDGVHRGHQEIIKRLTAGAHRSQSQAVVLTFYPHPAVVLRNRQGPYYLTSPEEQAALLGEMGVDIVITHPFNLEVAHTSARDFMASLKTHLELKHLWVGYDFALGHNREGDVPTLKRLGEEMNYEVEVLQPFKLEDEVVSSSRIRGVLREGQVGQAATLLGRPYRVSGNVTHGDGRGRLLGIPTANLEIWPERMIPKSGVYACKAILGGKICEAVTNVGVRPTFENQPATPTVEAHLLEFDEDIYGRKLQLDFIARLRDEQRFPSIQALVAQIKQDIEQARQIF